MLAHLAADDDRRVSPGTKARDVDEDEIVRAVP